MKQPKNMKEYRYKAQTIRSIIKPEVSIEDNVITLSLVNAEQLREYMKLSCMDDVEKEYLVAKINEVMVKVNKLANLEHNIKCYKTETVSEENIRKVAATYRNCLMGILSVFPMCNTAGDVLRFFYEAVVVGDLTKLSYINKLEFEREHGSDFVKRTMEDAKIRESLISDGNIDNETQISIYRILNPTQPIMVIPSFKTNVRYIIEE